jgi:hypothetical protein
MGRFYSGLVADTPRMAEYVKRGLKSSIVWAPGRMIDQVDLILNEWRKNENVPGPGLSSQLPIIIVCIDNNFTPSLVDFSAAIGTPVDVMFPDDPLNRAYKVRTSANDYRTQIAILAPDQPTAHSLATQFNLFAQGPDGRRFMQTVEFAGQTIEFPVELEDINIGAVAHDVQKNLRINVADIVLRATVPIFQAPGEGEDNDGKAAPSGYPLVTQVTTSNPYSGASSSASIDENGVVTESRN